MLPSMKYPANPNTVKMARAVSRTLTLPSLSARTPMAYPTTATASEGRVMISDTSDSCPGKLASISGSAGATAAPPMRMSMELRRMATRVSFVGLKTPFSLCMFRPLRGLIFNHDWLNNQPSTPFNITDCQWNQVLHRLYSPISVVRPSNDTNVYRSDGRPSGRSG